jgi:hypothetical protein
MKRADAQKAIDEAFAEGLKHLFVVLVQNLQGEARRDAENHFMAGIAFHDEAHAKASTAIDRIFPE